MISDPPRRLKFGVNTIAAIATLVAGQILGWIGTKAMFTYFAPSPSSPGVGYIGDITLFITIFNVVIGLGGFRVGAAYTFFVARGAEKKSLTGSYFFFTLGAFGALAVVTAVLGLYFDWYQGAYRTAFLLFMLVPVIEVPSTIYQNLRIAEGRAAPGQVPALVEASVRMGLIVYFSHLLTPSLVAVDNGVGIVTDVALAYVIGAIAGAIAALPMFKEVSMKGLYASLKDMLVYAAPLAGGLFFTYAGSFVVPLLVEAFKGTRVLVDFTAPNAFLILLLFVPYAVTLPLFPDLAAMHAKGHDEAIRLRVRQASRYTLMLITPGILVVSIFRVNLLNLFYSNAVAQPGQFALVILGLSALPTSLFRITGTALDAVGLQKREFWISSAQFAALIGAIVLLVPTYSAAGAAGAVLISGIVGLALNAVYMYRFLPVKFPLRSILMVAVASVITFTTFSNTYSVANLLGIHWDLGNKFVLVAIIFVGLAVYGLVLAAIGELAKQDVRDLVRTSGLPESWGNALSRLCWRASWPEEGHFVPNEDGD